MTAKLVRLRIAGFKSFAEPVSLDILPGLTGIVGPNGCGKSNVADALRWAMGEVSARSLRGGEMDDVIFAGTTARASRNLAEVSVSLEAGDTLLPAPFDAEAELQVTRRIERGAGSIFRANGRELRARDVQTLYADLASGARSSGMVSQGRVAALVAARPEERRQVLEEAAGIAGLHARRHEAELKLRAAEQNLSRADDAKTQIDTARDALRKQARQAARYRAISDLIRAAEAEHLAIQHGRAATAQGQAQAALEAAQSAVRAAEQEHETAGAALADAEAALPQPRAREADARGVLERRRLESDALAQDAARAQAEHAAAAARLDDLAGDLAAAARAHDDAGGAAARLGDQHDSLLAELAVLPDQLRIAIEEAHDSQHAFEACQVAAETADAQANAAARRTAETQVTRREAAARAAELRARHADAERERASAAGLRVPQEALETARANQTRSQATLDQARSGLDAVEATRAETAAEAAEAAGHAARQHALRRHAEAAIETCAERLTTVEAAWSDAAAALAHVESKCPGQESLIAADRIADSAEAALIALEEKIDAAEHAAAAAREQANESRRTAVAQTAELRMAETAREAAQVRLSRASAQAAEARRALTEESDKPPVPSELKSACLASAAAEAAAEATAAAARAHEMLAIDAAQAAAILRAAAADAAAKAALLSAEAEGLAASLGPEPQDGVLASLNVPPGLEAAVGAALGQAALSSLDPGQPAYWQALGQIASPAPPPGTIALSALLEAPAALRRALSHAVLLDGAADGAAVQAILLPGMVAIDRNGGCWRWDGHVVRPEAPNPAASTLSLRRRLAGISAALETSTRAALDAEAGSAAATGAEADAQAEAVRLRDAAEHAATDRVEALARFEILHDAARRRDQRIDMLHDAARHAEAELDEASRHAADTEAAWTALPAPDPALHQELEAAASACQTALEAARSVRLACRSRAAETRQLAQSLSAEAARSQALIEAASVSLKHTAAARNAAQQSLSEAEAALAMLPDTAELDTKRARLAAAEQACRAEESAAREARRLAEAAFETARSIAAELQLAHSQAEMRWSSLSDLFARAQTDLCLGEQASAEAEQAWRALPDSGALEAATKDASRRREVARDQAAQADARVRALQAALAHAERTLPSLTAELRAWQARLGEAEERTKNLAARHAAACAEAEALAAAPAALEARAMRLHQALAAAISAHDAATACLEASHGRVRALAGAERDAAREAGGRREALARAQAELDASASRIASVAARIGERLGGSARLPDTPDRSDAALDRAARRTERLTRERDEMGPVNLRAEIEVAELDEKLAALARDQEELTTAIAKLRGAIGHLNREGRTRLQTVFSQVDQHFRTLFTRMMGGGQAHLAWTGSGDPLEAGLDIFAEPPGKKLASLSLLSGGEQALTALSLIFAVFRCTPAPLCVLDEVDAPLDDANVDRFCTLLDDMARETGTSFLVVTHHQLTMSRMDRLYGVTMQERGVSRLLSVDLARAMALAEPVRAAAE